MVFVCFESKADIGMQLHWNYRKGMKTLKIPNTFGSKKELIEHFAKRVPFPEFYSLNWDSFASCLSEILEIDQLDLHVEHIGWSEAQYKSVHPYRQILLDALLTNKNFTVNF